MNATDLMVGDFIRLKESKNIVVVEAIDYDGNVSNNHVVDFFFCEGFCSGEKRYNYAPDCFEPIPLTPEILEKNGFKRAKYGYEWKERIGGYMGQTTSSTTPNEIMYYDEGHCVVSNSHIGRVFQGSIDSVHELQHALRLCGIEKEIIL